LNVAAYIKHVSHVSRAQIVNQPYHYSKRRGDRKVRVKVKVKVRG
jgi:hypothetical protein